MGQHIRFHNIGTEKGLSVGFVHTVLQDSRGFMWFGTQDGLNFYNGYQMKVYRNNPKDTQSISGNDIHFLFEDRKQRIWIGTNGEGIDVFDPKTESFKAYKSNEKNKNSLSHNMVRCMAEDAKGNLFIGTIQGLNYFEVGSNRFHRFPFSNENGIGTTSSEIAALYNDEKNGLWIGNYGSGLQLKPHSKDEFIQIQIPDKFYYKNKTELFINENFGKIKCISKIDENILGIGTDGAGFLLFNTKSKSFIEHHWFNHTDKNQEPGLNRIWSISKDAEGVIWLGTFGGGLIEFHPEKNNYLIHQKSDGDTYSLRSNEISTLLVDHQNNIWLATQSGGVNVYFRSANKFKHLKRDETSLNSINNDHIHAVLKYKNELWLATFGGGVNVIDQKTGKVRLIESIIKKYNAQSVLSLLQRKNGEICIGTYGQGVICFQPENNVLIDYLGDANGGGTVLSMAEDKNGIIWVASYGDGLFGIDTKNKKVVNYKMSDGLSSDNLYSILIEKNQTVWIGTEGGGAMKITGLSLQNIGSVTNYTKSFKQLGSNTVNYILPYKERVFFCTSGGLDILNLESEKFEHLNENDGLPNNFVYGIIPDKKENFWVSTNKGIACLSLNEKSPQIRKYDVDDGLQGQEFNQGAFYTDNSNNIYFGGENGLNIFNPEKLQDNPHRPPVFISGFNLFGKEAKLDTNILNKKFISLNYRDNFISLEFVALDYLNPEKNLYSYMMEGVDEDWSVPSPNRIASYPKMEGGEYVFKVKACNNDGVWNNEPTILHIHIDPPWWKTKLFYFICAVAIILGMLLYTRWRTASIKQEKKILEQKVNERTLELKQKNEDITASIEYAKRIQLAILPPESQIFKKLVNAFILYKPKDIVSGDFYWFGEKNNLKIIAAVDCTGHGVPGAFMSMIGNNLLNQIILEGNITDPGKILSELHKGVQNALRQGIGEVKTSDGMDVALCAISTQEDKVYFSGANRNLIVVKKNGELEKHTGNKLPIGGAHFEPERIFTTLNLQLETGDHIYIFSDGYADQFGGKTQEGKKFMVKRLHDLFCTIHNEEPETQRKVLEETIEHWRGPLEQVDDILVIGVRL